MKYNSQEHRFTSKMYKYKVFEWWYQKAIYMIVPSGHDVWRQTVF